MSKFKVGDRVRVVKHRKGKVYFSKVGDTGTIIKSNPLGLFETKIEHDKNRCWESFMFDDLELIEHCVPVDYMTLTGIYTTNYEPIKKPLMKTVSNMMKKLLDKNTQTLVKAGYINGDLELTSEGTRALMELLFTQNTDALVASAQAKIDEELANK